MIKFQKEDVILNVSKFDNEGYWICNCKESVARGTALGNNFTENVYEPVEGKLGVYDKKLDKWTEEDLPEIQEEEFNLEEYIYIQKQIARSIRAYQFKALDLYDKAVLRGDVEESADAKVERDLFRRRWLDVPNNVNSAEITAEMLFPDIPKAIEYFLPR